MELHRIGEATEFGDPKKAAEELTKYENTDYWFFPKAKLTTGVGLSKFEFVNFTLHRVYTYVYSMFTHFSKCSMFIFKW